MKRCHALIVAMALLLPCALRAHEGHDDEAGRAPVAAPPGDAPPRPHLLADGQLFMSKATQRALGVRTEVFAAQQGVLIATAGEVIADPDAAGAVTAAQPGRLEAPESGWPLPGSRVNAGETLAYLRPLLSRREQAQRRAALAQIDNDMQISEINVARLKLQAEANGTLENNGNVYYEQARLDWEGLKEKYRLESEALNSRVAIRAPGSGVVFAVNGRPGDVVAEGQSLFEIADAARLRIAVHTFDASLAQRLQSAQLAAQPGEGEGGAVALALRGQEPLPGQQGWRLLFEATPPVHTALTQGRIVKLSLLVSAPDAVQVPANACVAGTGQAGASVWVHVAPERFERRRLAGCQFASRGSGSTLAVAAGERVVTQGAALLSEYR